MKLDQLSINTIRTLSMDAVQEAMSGHPGTPMALAPLIYTLWNRAMRFDPQDRELVYLAVSESNGCNYCVSAHTMVATKQSGLSESDALAARRFHSTDKKRAALLEFIRKVIATKGLVSAEEVAEVQEAGYTDGQITEAIGYIGLATFSNLFNHVHHTPLDFPPAAKLQ